MNTAHEHRTIRVFFEGWVLDDLHLAPAVGDVMETRLDFIDDPTSRTIDSAIVRAVARPVYGHAPGGGPGQALRWPIALTGDGWSAKWSSTTPVSGRVEVTGYFGATTGARWPDDPVPVRGTVREVHLIEKRRDRDDSGGDSPNMDRRTRVDATPRRFWSDFSPVTEDESFGGAGVVVELDLDDPPEPAVDFVAGSVSEHGTDIWVMERSDPILLHLDTAVTPAMVTEYLLPMTIECPGDSIRFVNADGRGCWISSRHDVFRCDRSDDGTLVVERLCTQGGALVIDDGSVYLLGSTRAAAHVDRRHGVIRVEAAAHPVQRLDDDGRRTPIDDPETLTRIRDARQDRRSRMTVPGRWWHCDGGELTVRSADDTERTVDITTRERGIVDWIQSDPFDDPAIAELIPMISLSAGTEDG